MTSTNVTPSYRISNTVSGADLGVYQGATADEAIRAMLADAQCSDEPSAELTATREYVGLTITHVIERDGFGGEETQADVDAYCQAVADAISLVYPGADVSCETGLSRHTEISGDLAYTLDAVEIDDVRDECREAARAVWEAGDFWTEVEPKITDEQIRALSAEAATAGDDEQVRLCELALSGDADARATCERAIRDARAQVEV